MCDIIWCKKEKDGKPCDTVNYLDPYCFWNWEGKVGVRRVRHGLLYSHDQRTYVYRTGGKSRRTA